MQFYGLISKMSGLLFPFKQDARWLADLNAEKTTGTQNTEAKEHSRTLQILNEKEAEKQLKMHSSIILERIRRHLPGTKKFAVYIFQQTISWTASTLFDAERCISSCI